MMGQNGYRTVVHIRCGHYQLPIAEPGPCLTCERAKDPTNKGPLASFAGGRDGWRNGDTIGESMRENRANWEAAGLTGDNAPEYLGPRRRRS